MGRTDYATAFERMRAFTAERSAQTPDALWFCEHNPVFTQGLAGQTSHVINPGDVPVLASDRGGQVTYHGPGQLVAYPLVDLRRAGYFVKEFVYRLEETIIATLAQLGVTGHRVAGAPGVFVLLDNPFSHAMLPQRPQRRVPGSSAPVPDFSGLGKISALGIKITRHCSYHGAALNVAMDLSPFSRINPCGYAKLATVDLSTIGVQVSVEEVSSLWEAQLQARLRP